MPAPAGRAAPAIAAAPGTAAPASALSPAGAATPATPAAPPVSTAAAPPATPLAAPGADTAFASPAGGVFLQLGAFSGERNAEDLLAKVRAQVGAWTEPMRIVTIGNLHRIHVGPYASRESALAAARVLQARTDIIPVIVAR
ncbi:SPOR domain-containing protein [Pigmentiphaga soli]